MVAKKNTGLVVKKTNAVAKTASEEQISALALGGVEQEASYTRISLPRFGMVAQDKTEEHGTGKNKTISVIEAAGTFFYERETEDEVERKDGTMGKEWTHEQIDENEVPEIIIVAARKQLRYWDTAEKKYTSSPVFDTADEEVVLFKDRQEVDRGTMRDLQSRFPKGTTSKGKKFPLLKEEAILYVLIEGELFQMNVRGSSLWALSSYKRKVPISTVVTALGYEQETSGSNTYTKMTFNAVRKLNAQEAEMAIEKIREIKQAIADQKEYFSGMADDEDDDEEVVEKSFNDLTKKEDKHF